MGPDPIQAARRAWERCLAEAGWQAGLDTEAVPLTAATGRRTATPLSALWSSPAHDLAAMDGVAVRAADTVGAPAVLETGLFEIVDTGDPIPPGRDAVIPRERVRWLPDGRVGLEEPVAPGRHIRPAGEDVAAGETLLPAGHRLRPVDIAVLAAAGHVGVMVTRSPRVAVLPTGDEVRPIGAMPGRGEVLDTNSPMLIAMATEAGATARALPVARDDPEVLADAVRTAACDSDVVLVIAGSSAGRDDHTPAVLARLGHVAVQGVAMRPGHPVVLGVLAGHEGRAVPVVGVPGYPVAAAHVFATFIAPLLARMAGEPLPRPETVVARLISPVTSPATLDHTLPIQLMQDARGEAIAMPVLRGAGALSALMHADALLRVPSGCASLPEGTMVMVEPLAGAPAAPRRLC